MTNKKNIIVLIGALLGNMMEYFDFTVYSMFAVAIGIAFFPEYSSDAQLLLSFSIFAVGFFTRPIGGIIFGYVGTKFSKKISLIISSAMMAFATFGIGLMPDYNDIGIASAYWLVTFRMLQGICVGGEGASVAIYILEHIKNCSKGLITGVSHASNIAGTVLAAIAGIIIFDAQENAISKTTELFDLIIIKITFENLWRCAFIFGGTLSLISMILRIRSYQNSNTINSITFNSVANTNNLVNLSKNIPINSQFNNLSIANVSADNIANTSLDALNNSAKIANITNNSLNNNINNNANNTKPSANFFNIIYDGFSNYYKQILVVIFLSGLASSIIYIAKSYMNIIFAEKYNSFEIGSQYTLIISLMIMACMPIFGWINNSINAIRLSKYTIGIIIAIIPIMSMINNSNIIVEYIGLILYACMTGLIATASYLFCIRLFPQKKRFFIVSFAYNTGVAIFGGTTPMISAWLIYLTKYNFAPGLYIIFICILLLIALFYFKGLNLFEIEE
ncbi:MAG: MFS transporter [Rickettsiales bacterium]